MIGVRGGTLVLHDGKTVIEKSYGFANRDAGIRADTSTVYNLGSITKQFTAAAILRLEETGKLHTSDSITSPRATSANAKSDAIVAALVRGDVGPLHDALDDPPDSAELGRQERGTATNIYTWNMAGKIVDVGARPYESIELMAEGNGGFRSYNIRTGGGLRVRVEGGPSSNTLLVTTPRGVVRLVR